MTAINNKFPEDEYFFPPVSESSRLLVGCRREDYSASRIARAVEDCDAHLLNLNVTSMGDDNGKNTDPTDIDESVYGEFPVVFDLRVSHRNPAGISRSLERYGYTVLSACGNDIADSDTSRRRIDHLLRYLEI
ncbi:MAG: hypothetical protein K2F91_03035 [Muribaculaceae bacterium]|nr:hypothetical protein [Muribaculaceae bacterium]MDE6196825.1 hypothetical protein [Muribaculaceae bacterium]